MRISVGVLPRLQVTTTEVRHIGKESNRLEEVAAGALDAPSDVYVEYHDERSEWEKDRAVLQGLAGRPGGIAALAARLEMSDRTLRSNLCSGRLPRRAAREKLRALARATVCVAR